MILNDGGLDYTIKSRRNVLLDKIRDVISGPERVFHVVSIEIGNVYTERYLSMTPGWGGGGGNYEAYRQVRPVTVVVKSEGLEYKIEAVEDVERTFHGLIFGDIYPEDAESLQQSVGQSVRGRAKTPYNSRTLKKLAKLQQVRGESQ